MVEESAVVPELTPAPPPSSREGTPRTPPPGPRPAGLLGNRIFAAAAGLAALSMVGLALLIVVVMLHTAQPSIERFGFGFLTTRVWESAPANIYGIVPAAEGTVATSLLALALAVPLSLGAAIFLTQHSPPWLREPVGQVIELLAAIPSIVFGFWGLIVLVPIMRYDVEPPLKTSLGWTGLFGGTPIGIDLLTASIVLSVMTIPTITAIARDSVQAVPRSQKEAAMSLGATDWEVTRNVVLPYSRAGIVAGIALGFGRALGETMAVSLLVGNSLTLPTSLFSAGETISSLIATHFVETSGALETSALIEAGLFLLVVTLAINLVARTVLLRFGTGTPGDEA